jgi:hypothetical protein
MAWEAKEGEPALQEMEVEMEMEMEMERIFWLFVKSTLMIIVGWKNWTPVGRPVSTKIIRSKWLLREKSQ